MLYERIQKMKRRFEMYFILYLIAIYLSILCKNKSRTSIMIAQSAHKTNDWMLHRNAQNWMSGESPWLREYRAELRHRSIRIRTTAALLRLRWDGPVGCGVQNTPAASLQRTKNAPTSVLDMTLSNLNVRLQ